MAYLDLSDIFAAEHNDAPAAFDAPNNFLTIASGNRLEGLGNPHVAGTAGFMQSTQSGARSVLTAVSSLETSIRSWRNTLDALGESVPEYSSMLEELSSIRDTAEDFIRQAGRWLSSMAAWTGEYAGRPNDVIAKIQSMQQRVSSMRMEAQSLYSAAYNSGMQTKRQREQEDYARTQYESQQAAQREQADRDALRRQELEERRIALEQQQIERQAQLEEQRAARAAQLEEQRLQAQLASEQQRLQMDMAMQQQQLQLQAAQEQARLQMEAQRAAMDQQIALQAAMPAAASPQVSTQYYGVLPVGQGYAPGYGYDAWAQPSYGYEPNYYAAPPSYGAAPAAPMVDYGAAPAAWAPGGNELFGMRGLGLTLSPTQLAAAQQAGAAVGSSPPVPGMVMSPSGRWVNPTTTVTVTRPNSGGPGVIEGAVNALTSTVNTLAPTALQFAEVFTGRRSSAPSPVPVQRSSSLGDWLLPAAAVAGGAYLLFGRKKTAGRRRGR